jgi:hypothetical protein
LEEYTILDTLTISSGSNTIIMLQKYLASEKITNYPKKNILNIVGIERTRKYL